MSDKTLNDLEEAIQAHLRDIHDNNGEILTGWVVMTAYTTIEAFDSDRSHGYIPIMPVGMPFHEQAGLFHLAELAVAETWNKD